MAGSHAEVRWDLVVARPAAVLRGLVAEYRGFADDNPLRVPERAYPSACVPLVIDTGSGWRVASPAAAYRPVHLRGFAAGMHDAFTEWQATGPALGVQVNLTPLGARRLLAVPMHELTNRVVPFDDLFAGDARWLTERLAGARDWRDRFALVDAILAARLVSAPAVSPGVEWAWERLVVSGGAYPIGDLGAELGWSRKRLVARFREEIGLTPKTASRLLRFDALVAKLGSGRERASWAELAADLGFSDQAHLAREVRRFTGQTPSQLLGSLIPVRLQTVTAS
jgi:AraC-like DNA-binding protein